MFTKNSFKFSDQKNVRTRYRVIFAEPKKKKICGTQKKEVTVGAQKKGFARCPWVLLALYRSSLCSIRGRLIRASDINDYIGD
jgi:hypothetical protein